MREPNVKMPMPRLMRPRLACQAPFDLSENAEPAALLNLKSPSLCEAAVCAECTPSRGTECINTRLPPRARFTSPPVDREHLQIPLGKRRPWVLGVSGVQEFFVD